MCWGLLLDLKIAALLSTGWAFSHFLTVVAIELALVAPLPNTVPLFYLPHGVQLLAAWAYGWRSVLYLLPIIMLITFGGGDIQKFELSDVFVSFFNLISAPLGIRLVRCIIANEQRFARLRLNWRILVLGGLLATVFNSGSIQVINQSTLPLSEELSHFLWLVTSDMAGLMIVLTCLMFMFRWVRMLYQDKLGST